MFIQDELQGIKKIKGMGIIQTLVIPKKTEIKDFKHNLSISVPKKEITFLKGKNMFILADNYAIKEAVDFSMFFIGKCLVIELHKGTIYVKSNNMYYSITSKNNVKLYEGKLEELYECSFNRVYKDCIEILTRKYNLSNKKEISDYVNNIGFSIRSSFNFNNGKLYDFKIYEYFDDLTLGLMQFEEKPIAEVKKVVSLSEIIPTAYENIDIEYKTVKKKKHKNLLSDMTLSLDDDDDDMDELPENMHEVDLDNESEFNLDSEEE